MHVENSWKHIASKVSAGDNYYQLFVHVHMKSPDGCRNKDSIKWQVTELELFFILTWPKTRGHFALKSKAKYKACEYGSVNVINKPNNQTYVQIPLHVLYVLLNQFIILSLRGKLDQADIN